MENKIKHLLLICLITISGLISTQTVHAESKIFNEDTTITQGATIDTNETWMVNIGAVLTIKLNTSASICNKGVINNMGTIKIIGDINIDDIGIVNTIKNIGTINNYYKIWNNGSISSDGVINNDSVIYNEGILFIKSGILNNNDFSDFKNYPSGFVVNKGIFNNHSHFSIDGVFTNNNTINNYGSLEITSVLLNNGFTNNHGILDSSKSPELGVVNKGYIFNFCDSFFICNLHVDGIHVQNISPV
ncbi:MAG: hypothetical protein GY710_02310 [Desulfobacteraceae bacterium]|nr:hypothetical protein [Desulfobacteraceae bacterium]